MAVFDPRGKLNRTPEGAQMAPTASPEQRIAELQSLVKSIQDKRSYAGVLASRVTAAAGMEQFVPLDKVTSVEMVGGFIAINMRTDGNTSQMLISPLDNHVSITTHNADGTQDGADFGTDPDHRVVNWGVTPQ